MRVKILIVLNSGVCIKTELEEPYNQLYQIRFSNTKIIPAACRMGWK